jgi:hypothetical protein
MDVTYDNLSIEISNNYHTNAQGLRSGTDVVYGMKVRKDKPYVLDFSNEPMVVFDQPPTSQTTFSRGDEIAFAAVLVDPKLDIMIRGLDDTSVKVDKEYKDRDGKVIHTAKVNKPLDPNVVVGAPTARSSPRASCPLAEPAPAGTRGVYRTIWNSKAARKS